MPREIQIIPWPTAVLCVSCRAVSNATSETCPACGDCGSLLSLARVLQPTPELGQITYVLSAYGINADNGGPHES